MTSIHRFRPTLPAIAENTAEAEANRRIQPLQTPPPLENTPVSPLSLTLDKGKLRLADSNPTAMNTLLEQTLGKEGQHYVAHTASAEGNHHMLLDEQGHLFDLKSHEGGYSVFHNSLPSTVKMQLSKNNDEPIKLVNDNGKLILDRS